MNIKHKEKSLIYLNGDDDVSDNLFILHKNSHFDTELIDRQNGMIKSVLNSESNNNKLYICKNKNKYIFYKIIFKNSNNHLCFTIHNNNKNFDFDFTYKSSCHCYYIQKYRLYNNCLNYYYIVDNHNNINTILNYILNENIIANISKEFVLNLNNSIFYKNDNIHHLSKDMSEAEKKARKHYYDNESYYYKEKYISYREYLIDFLNKKFNTDFSL